MSILKNNKVGFFLLILCALFLLSPSSGRSESMIGYGDSITQGLWMVQEPGDGRRVGGYEPFLEDLFASVGRDVRVYNFGVGGETTAQALTSDENSPRTIYSVLAGHYANYILIMEGTNDILRGISPASTAANLGLMINASRAYNVTPVLATLTPDERGFKNIPYTNSLIRNMAQEKGVLLVDQYNALIANWDSYNSDGVHPNRGGYQAMAKAWFEPFLNLKLETLGAETAPFSAKLNGSVSANGVVSGIAFQIGTEPNPEETVKASPEFSSGSGKTAVVAEITGLKQGTKYYYRIKAEASGSTIYGETKTLNTPQLALTWLSLLLKKSPPAADPL